MTVESCQRECQKDPKCLGFDFDLSNNPTSTCFLHQYDTFGPTFQATTVDQYIRKEECLGDAVIYEVEDAIGKVSLKALLPH